MKSQTLTDLYLGRRNIPVFIILLVDGLIMFLLKYSCEVFSVEQLRSCKQSVLIFLRLHCILIIVVRNRMFCKNLAPNNPNGSFWKTFSDLTTGLQLLWETVVDCCSPVQAPGCKNRPALFPGWMSYKLTKPGLVLFCILACFNCIVVY